MATSARPREVHGWAAAAVVVVGVFGLGLALNWGWEDSRRAVVEAMVVQVGPPAVAALPEQMPLPTGIRAGAEVDRALDDGFSGGQGEVGTRPFYGYALGMYAYLQACAGAKVGASSPIWYSLSVDSDRGGAAVVSYRGPGARERALMSDWKDVEVEVFEGCLRAFLAAHPGFRSDPSWWGRRMDLALGTKFPVWRARIYEAEPPVVAP